jgi:3-methyladenine DNA glycosylase/8-oxoguanine DNA glycosylase
VAHDQLRLEAFGPGAEWALHIGPDLVGHHDNLDGFQPDGVVAALHRKLPGMRILKAHTVLQCLVLVILEQKVVGKQAWQGYHGLYRRLGEPAPGPRPLVLPPDPAALAALPYYEMHGMGIERRRAETILFAAKRAKRLAELPELPLGLAKQRLGAFRGIGPWSVAELARVALGDADAISVGDYHLPKVVAYNLGAPAEADSADDARMLELLAPYAGHRGRVQRLIEAGGKSPPRRGPRLAPIDLRWR